MTSNEYDILINIIGGVESGGQQYGKRDYSAYAPAYHASPDEHTCTLGWCQLYGDNARKLLNRIYEMDKSVVPTNIVSMLKVDWVGTRWNPDELQKQSLIKAITSTPGKKCQDEMFKEITRPVINKAQDLGVSDVGCQIMFVEIAHLGGISAAQRIFNKSSKPYTVDGIFNTLMLDQKDTSNNNQVGDKFYQSRHECCVKWIKQYLNNSQITTKGSDVVSVTKEQAINAMISTAEAEIGYLEKASNSQLDSKTANAGSNNYTKYWRDIGLNGWQQQPWCAAWVSWVFMKTFGLDTAKKLLKHWPYTYCPNMANLFTLNANPKKGDIVIFYRNGEFAHTGIVIDVNGDQFTTIEGNTSNGSTIIANGGGVCKKSYYNSNLPGTKFCTPDYSIVTKILSGNTTATATTTTSSSTSNETKTIWSGKVNKANAKVRTWAGAEYPEVSFSPLKKNTAVDVQYAIKDTKNRDWYFIKVGELYGFIYGKYVTKNETKTNTAPKTTTQYRVQGGAYSVLKNAKATAVMYKANGYDAVVIKSGNTNIVQLGLFNNLENAQAFYKELKDKGFEVAIVAVKS